MKTRPRPESQVSDPAQRAWFFLTATVCGAAILIIEILGAKLLAPYLGTSHFVWTAQIAVTLGALAVGYYLGGRWADRAGSPAPLYYGLLVATLYLGGAVTQVERVAYACLNLRLALGSLLTSAFLFFVPLALLAMVCPFLVRFLTVSLADVGGSVGRLTALSTAGSVAGTLLIGYVLIPLLPNSVTILGTALAVALVAAVWLVRWGRRPLRSAALVGLVLAAGLGCLWQTQSRPLLVGPRLREVFRANSNFGLLQVIESRDGQRRYLLNDFLMQASYDATARQSTTIFSYLLHGLARGYREPIHDVLVIGLGGGIVPMEFAREGAQVDVVEINPAMLPVAQRFFDFDPNRVHVVFADGRPFLNATPRRYDAILVDAFLGDSAPSHLMTREAFAAMRERLRPGGVVVLNCWGNFEPGRDFLVTSVHKTLRAVFPHVRVHCDNRRQAQAPLLNVFFAASTEPLTLRAPNDFEFVHPLCRDEVAAAFATQIEMASDRGQVLTDDYNPVDVYDAHNREQERRALALRMQP
jgi:spermidine synthase